MNLPQINRILHKATNNELSLYKGKGYFYFEGSKSSIPKSIFTDSVKCITVEDLEDAIKYYIEENE